MSYEVYITAGIRDGRSSRDMEEAAMKVHALGPNRKAPNVPAMVGAVVPLVRIPRVAGWWLRQSAGRASDMLDMRQWQAPAGGSGGGGQDEPRKRHVSFPQVHDG